jgi:hypothetical protein
MTLDAARESLSRAGTRLGAATRNVWAKQAEYDEAERSGDDFDIIHASLALTTAERDQARRQAEYDAAEAVLVAAAIEDGEI